MMQDRERAAVILKQLSEMGISVAVDDFGTGYSNLSYLIDFSFQKLKIDRSFVSRIDTDSSSGAVVSTIVGLSRALGVHTIAEGVETESQATLLRAAGCEAVQGYLFGRPAPLEIEHGVSMRRMPRRERCGDVFTETTYRASRAKHLEGVVAGDLPVFREEAGKSPLVGKALVGDEKQRAAALQRFRRDSDELLPISGSAARP